MVKLKAEGLTKPQIRSKILHILKTQKEEERDRKSRIIKNKLFRALVFKKAKTAMFYIAFGGEVDTEEMIREAKRLGKTIAIPVCKKDGITISPCLLRDGAKTRKGLYGICEPVIRESIKLQDIDLVIVPGLAFDKKGRRLGRGRGCYDRFLKRITPQTTAIGLAFDFQILPSLPATPTDVNVKRVFFA